MLLKVGELAKRSGLTVRTLHHYDAIGLLMPSARSEAGYRLYNRDDIARLHQIQALRRLDLSLADIGAFLARPDSTLSSVIEQQIQALTLQIEGATDLRDRLARLHGQLMTGQEPDLADWLNTLEMMTMYDKYFTQEEQHQLRLNRDEAEWAALIEAVRSLMARGIPSESAEAQALGEHWLSIVERYTGGSSRLLIKLDTMHRSEPVAQQQSGITPEIMAYMMPAIKLLRLALYAKYLSAEELQYMRDNSGQLNTEWPGLIAEVRSAMDQDIPADAPEVQRLAQRWRDLFVADVGPNPETHQKIKQALESEPAILSGTGIDKDMLAYIRDAFARMPV